MVLIFNYVDFNHLVKPEEKLSHNPNQINSLIIFPMLDKFWTNLNILIFKIAINQIH